MYTRAQRGIAHRTRQKATAPASPNLSREPRAACTLERRCFEVMMGADLCVRHGRKAHGGFAYTILVVVVVVVTIPDNNNNALTAAVSGGPVHLFDRIQPGQGIIDRTINRVAHYNSMKMPTEYPSREYIIISIRLSRIFIYPYVAGQFTPMPNTFIAHAPTTHMHPSGRTDMIDGLIKLLPHQNG